MNDQDAINRAEWANKENWSDPFIGLYFSKRDTRIWVPKQIPALGWTLNLAHRKGAAWFLGLLLLPLVIVVGLLFWILQYVPVNTPH